MANIVIEDITTSALDGEGVFDKLMGTSMLHIEDQMEKGNITQGTAGEIYVATIQNAMAQAIQFVLHKELTEQQIEVAYADRIIKDKEAVKLGLDGQLKAINSAIIDGSIEDTYTPKYNSEV